MLIPYQRPQKINAHERTNDLAKFRKTLVHNAFIPFCLVCVAAAAYTKQRFIRKLLEKRKRVCIQAQENI